MLRRWWGGAAIVLAAVLAVALYAGHSRTQSPRYALAPAPTSAYTAEALPVGAHLATGPDGVLWLTPGFAGNPVSYIDRGGYPHSLALTGTHRQDLADLTFGADTTVWATAGDQLIMHFGETGQATAYAVPQRAAHICDLTASSDGTAWFLQTTESCGGRYSPQQGRSWIGHLARNGHLSEYVLPAGRYDCEQVGGPGGALWVLEMQGSCDFVMYKQEASWISQVTPEGRFTRYRLPRGTPQDMTLAPDGSLWLSDEGGRHFWHVSAGRLAQYTLPGALDQYAHAAGLTVGPDGNLWCIVPGLFDTSAVARITPRGRITAFNVSKDLSNDDRLFAGRHGDLWFEEQGGAIGHITTAGAVAEYPIADLKSAFAARTTVSSGSDWMYATFAVGPDGSAWFGVDGHNWLGRITPRGEIHEYHLLPAGSSPSSLTFDGAGNLWLVDATGHLARVSLPGQINTVPVPDIPPGMGAIVAETDGVLWFLDPVSNTLVRRSVTGTLTQFSMPTGQSGLRGLAAGPGGSVWFTEYAAGRLGRIDAHGTVAELALPAAASRPTSIVLGADGNLWFTESGTNQIGRITSSGHITEFPTGMPNGQPAGITAGPDSALWFTDDVGGRIGRMTLRGIVTVYALPWASGSPYHIARGPDGALWFTDFTANSIGRITTTGAIREFVLPTANCYPNDIVAGPDGALWFTERATGVVGRISTGGLYSEYPLANLSRAEGIAAAPDGTIWLTEADGNWLVQIATEHAATDGGRT